MRYIIVHPEFETGEVERFVTDLYKTLTSHGHSVEIATTLFDRNSAFAESKAQPIIVDQYPILIPRTIFGRFRAALTHIRMLLLVIYLAVFKQNQFDCFILDKASLPLFVPKLLGYRTVFYCQFPDSLEFRIDGSLVKAAYRLLIYVVELVTMRFADLVLCNSESTAKALNKYLWLDADRCKVIYPSSHIGIDTPCDQTPETTSLTNTLRKRSSVASLKMSSFDSGKKLFSRAINIEEKSEKPFICLSPIQRRKKLDVVIKSYMKAFSTAKAFPHLIIAGSINVRNRDDLSYYEELVALAKKGKFAERIDIRLSISDKEATSLLKKAICAMYPCENEYLGTLPIESMALGVPILAHRNGTLMEVVDDGKNGYLVGSSVEDWAEKIKLMANRGTPDVTAMTKACTDKFKKKYRPEIFEKKVKQLLE